jgi:hypothetical protein
MSITEQPEPKLNKLCKAISGFRRDVDEICDLLAYYAASSGNPFLLGLLDP